jgi:hypothetical protein
VASITLRASLLTVLGLLVAAALAVATLAAPSSAQAAPEGPNPSKACSERGDTIFGFPGEPPSTHGGCTSFAASGKLTGAGYSAQCKTLEAEFGGYPFVLEEPPPLPDFRVRNHGECVNALRYLHTNFGG